MMTSPAATGGWATLPRRALSRSPYWVLLGFTVLSFYAIYSSAGDEEAISPPTKRNDYAHQGDNIGLLADGRLSGFRGEHDVDALAPLARIPEGDTTGSLSMISHHRLDAVDLPQDVARPALVPDGSGEDLPAVKGQRRGEEGLNITEDTLSELQGVIVLQNEGIVYCPIPKAACSEWKRALRWMLGIKHWDADDIELHRISRNGLEQLTSRNLEEIRWALESKRYLRFVVVREPAERMVSAFMNKCVRGYQSGSLQTKGARNCPYLAYMPELFPNSRRDSPESHARLQDLLERDPEDTFFHFVDGIRREAEARGDPCKIGNIHYRPQICFCDLINLQPVFHVIPFSNLSAEAEALAGRIPATLSGSAIDAEGEAFGDRGMGAMPASVRRTGVDEARREEIHEFLTGRFTQYHDEAKEIYAQDITNAGEHKAKFLSERVMRVMHKIAEKDYDLLGEYF